MVSLAAVGRVLVGAFVTVLLSALAALLLPILAITTAVVVGDWLPRWVFATPLVLCPAAGGAITGFLQRTSRLTCALVGGLAAALGIAAVGALLGLVALTVLLGFTPAHGGATPDLSSAALTTVSLGGGAGFLVGAVVGAVGGIGGYAVRRRFA